MHASLIEQMVENANLRKRKLPSEESLTNSSSSLNKKTKLNTDMNEAQRQSNFSALNPNSNGFNHAISPITNNRPVAAKN